MVEIVQTLSGPALVLKPNRNDVAAALRIKISLTSEGVNLASIIIKGDCENPIPLQHIEELLQLKIMEPGNSEPCLTPKTL